MEVVNSFFSNIKDKLTNPYFGTLILVLILHHWELLFAVFNFDNNFSLSQKLNFVSEYISIYITWKSFMLDALQAALYMVTGYLIVVLTRSIVLFIEYKLMPFITGKIVSKNVVLKTDFDEVVREREEYFDQYEEQRNNVRSFSKTIDEQTEQLKQKDDLLLDQSNKISETIDGLNNNKRQLVNAQSRIDQISKNLRELESSNEILKKELAVANEKVQGYEDLFFDEINQNFYDSIRKFPPEVINKVAELKKENRWKPFLSLGSFFENGGSIGGDLLTEMISRGLAFERESREDLTPVGNIIYRYYTIFDEG